MPQFGCVEPYRGNRCWSRAQIEPGKEPRAALALGEPREATSSTHVSLGLVRQFTGSFRTSACPTPGVEG